MSKITFIFIFLSIYSSAQSKEDILNLLINKKILTQTEVDSLKKEIINTKSKKIKNQFFTLSGEIKPRIEIRNGYGNSSLPSSEKSTAVFVNQRTRLNFDYEYKNLFKTYISIQDARVWGMNDPRNLSGNLQLFEAFVEPYISENWKIIIGRQRFMLDNQRLFAENEWRVNAAAHDAIRVTYHTNQNLTTDLFAAWNQTFERFYGTDLTSFNNSSTPNSLETSLQPTGFNNHWENQWYKGLFVHHLKYKINSNFEITTIQVADIFQEKNSLLNTTGNPSVYVTANPEKHFTRFTNGGRVDFEKNNLHLTFSGYFQSGKNKIGKKINAFYLQPEIKFKKENNYYISLGAEIISGDGNTEQLSNSIDGNFDTLYGVAHRFNGFMDLFTNFYSGSFENGIASTGNHLKNNGLINPYLFLSKTINKKLELNSQNHAFWLQHNYISNHIVNKTYLGFETDLLLKYKPNKVTEMEVGYSYVFSQKSLAAIKGNNPTNSYQNPQWLYIQLKVMPYFLKTNF